MEEALTILRQAYRRSHLLQVIAGAVLFAAAGALILFLDRSGENYRMFLIILAAGLGMIGSWFLIQGVRELFAKPPLLEILEKSPVQVVWVHPYVVRTMPYGVEVSRMISIYFYLINGEKEVVQVSPKKVEPLLKILNNTMPNTTFGYSAEKATLYAANPAFLSRDNDIDQKQNT